MIFLLLEPLTSLGDLELSAAFWEMPTCTGVFLIVVKSTPGIITVVHLNPSNITQINALGANVMSQTVRRRRESSEHPRLLKSCVQSCPRN